MLKYFQIDQVYLTNRRQRVVLECKFIMIEND